MFVDVGVQARLYGCAISSAVGAIGVVCELSLGRIMCVCVCVCVCLCESTAVWMCDL